MKANRHDICVLGDGGWGTTLAIHLSRKGFNVSLWGAFRDYVKYLDKKRVNSKFLPGINIPEDITITADLGQALQAKQLVILAIPSQYLRQVLRKQKSAFLRQATYVSVIKGIETGSLKRMSEVLLDELGDVSAAVLSGPTIAHELAVGLPTTAVIASRNGKLSRYLQDIFITEKFRIYTSVDVVGVELGGSLKNVIAIACGISDGLGFGTNSKAALLSRGLAEISRLGRVMGADVKTFSGLSGLGDLVTTCISPYSRNRFMGEQIGRGKTLRQVSQRMQIPAFTAGGPSCRQSGPPAGQAGIAEGVPTAKSAYLLGRRHKVDMPITEQVFGVLYKNKSPLAAVRDLMNRDKKKE